MATAVKKSEAAGKFTQQDDKIDGKQTAEPKSDEEREAAETAAVASMNQLDLDKSSRSMAKVSNIFFKSSILLDVWYFESEDQFSKTISEDAVVSSHCV
jgi:hypothetical protein